MSEAGQMRVGVVQPDPGHCVAQGSDLQVILTQTEMDAGTVAFAAPRVFVYPASGGELEIGLGARCIRCRRGDQLPRSEVTAVNS